MIWNREINSQNQSPGNVADLARLLAFADKVQCVVVVSFGSYK